MQQQVVSVVVLLLMVYSIILHEISHGYSALLLGDSTARNRGRLTLNPIPHIHPIYTILMPLALFIFSSGMFVMGGANPVPINPYLFRNPKRDMALTAAAGPITNICIALGFVILLRIPPISPNGSANQAVFLRVAFLNMFLAAFNLIPVLPLDGGRVVVGLLPKGLSAVFERTEVFGLVGVIVVVFMLQALGVLGFIAYRILELLQLLSGLPTHVINQIFT